MTMPEQLDINDEDNRYVLAILHCLGIAIDKLTAEQYDQLYKLVHSLRMEARASGSSAGLVDHRSR